MKRLFFLSIVIFLVSCKKNDAADPVPATPSLAAQTITDISYGTHPSQKMDIYLPGARNEDSTNLMILIHGGGWNTGDKSDFSGYVPQLKVQFANYAIANINYRLATTTSNHFPTQENDLKAAIDFLIQKSQDYQISQKIVLLGASAGAHMALLQAYKYSTPKIKAVVDFFGPTDMAGLHNFYGGGSYYQSALQILMNGNPNTNSVMYDQSSPIKFVSTQSSPTIIFHGANDNVVPIVQSVSLRNKLNSLGVVNELTSYPNVGHEVWPPATMNDAFKKVQAFLKSNIQ